MQIYATIQLSAEETLTKSATEIAAELAAVIAPGQTVETCQVTVTSTSTQTTATT